MAAVDVANVTGPSENVVSQEAKDPELAKAAQEAERPGGTSQIGRGGNQYSDDQKLARELQEREDSRYARQQQRAMESPPAVAPLPYPYGAQGYPYGVYAVPGAGMHPQEIYARELMKGQPEYAGCFAQRRWRITSSLILASFILAALAYGTWLLLQPEEELEPDVQSMVAFDRTNDYRAQKGLGTVQWDDDLLKIATEHAEKMAAGEAPFSHEGFQDRRQQYADEGWCTQAFSENLAKVKCTTPGLLAFEGWLQSQEHKENIENGRWTHSAIGGAEAEDGTYYFTQLFAQHCDDDDADGDDGEDRRL